MHGDDGVCGAGQSRQLVGEFRQRLQSLGQFQRLVGEPVTDQRHGLLYRCLQSQQQVVAKRGGQWRAVELVKGFAERAGERLRIAHRQHLTPAGGPLGSGGKPLESLPVLWRNTYADGQVAHEGCAVGALALKVTAVGGYPPARTARPGALVAAASYTLRTGVAGGGS